VDLEGDSVNFRNDEKNVFVFGNFNSNFLNFNKKQKFNRIKSNYSRVISAQSAYYEYFFKKNSMFSRDFDFNLGFLSLDKGELINDFYLNESEEYSIFIRIFAGKESGEISFYLDDSLIETFNFNDNKEEFEWFEINSLKINKGDHSIKLISKNGINLINTLIIDKTNIVRQKEEAFNKLLVDGTLFYVYEGEKINSIPNSHVIYSLNYSNYAALLIPGKTKLTQSINIANKGIYDFSLFFDIIENNSEIYIDLNENSFNYSFSSKGSNKIDLKLNLKTVNLLEIKSNKQIVIDKLFISDKKVFDLFYVNKSKFKEKIQFFKINPTKYEIVLPADLIGKNTNLLFKETYEDCWNLQINDKIFKSERTFFNFNLFVFNVTSDKAILECSLQRRVNFFFYMSLACLLFAIIFTLILVLFNKRNK